MPLFFLLAGFFFRPKPIRFGQLFINKMRTRLSRLVFCCYNYAALDASLSVENARLHTSRNMGKTWLLLRGWPVANWPCWFLVCLFSVELIASELIPFLVCKRFLLALPVTYAAGWFLTQIARLPPIFWVSLMAHGSYKKPSWHCLFICLV